MSRLLPRWVCPSLIFVLVSSLWFSGCASKLTRAPAGSVADTASDVNQRTQEYLALRWKIESIHSASIFGQSTPRLFDASTADTMGAGLTKQYCSGEVSPTDCARKINQVIFSALSERYFAADPVAVQRTCVNEPLICDDLNALETLYRHLHNASVEESEREKLSLIDEWRQGQLSDDELKAALHVDFKFQDGKLVLNPSA